MRLLKGGGRPGLFSLPPVKDKKCHHHDESKAEAIIPSEFVAEI
jgi:hypothetical protein